MRISRSSLLLYALSTTFMLLAATLQLHAQQPDTTELAWEQQMQARHDALIKKYGSGTNKTLSAQLMKMGVVDQNARRRLFFRKDFNSLPKNEQEKLSKEIDSADAKTTVELKQIVAKYGWPTIPLVGVDASHAASLMLDHSRDLTWKKSLLPQLQSLARQGQVESDGVAVVVDNALVTMGKPQRFGTYFSFKNDRLVLWPVEDPAHLDQRRAAYYMQPMSEYTRMMEQIYRMKAK